MAPRQGMGLNVTCRDCAEEYNGCGDDGDNGDANVLHVDENVVVGAVVVGDNHRCLGRTEMGERKSTNGGGEGDKQQADDVPVAVAKILLLRSGLVTAHLNGDTDIIMSVCLHLSICTSQSVTGRVRWSSLFSTPHHTTLSSLSVGLHHHVIDTT
jgi:hypothetical protein